MEMNETHGWQGETYPGVRTLSKRAALPYVAFVLGVTRLPFPAEICACDPILEGVICLG